MDQQVLSKAEQFRLLTETSSDSLMGRLLREFWHPIALADEVPKGKARPVRVLSEDLTLYRGESGKPYLVGGRCAHRCSCPRAKRVKGRRCRSKCRSAAPATPAAAVVREQHPQRVAAQGEVNAR